jgi:DNA-binding transcriptional regulator YdaS (Cro superfamily)
MTKKTPFEKVVETVGSQVELARLLGLAPSTIGYWAKSGIPAEKAVELEVVTKETVPRWMARPDLWGAPFRVSEIPSTSPTPALSEEQVTGERR